LVPLRAAALKNHISEWFAYGVLADIRGSLFSLLCVRYTLV
jgi:hypothetical protein